MLVLSVASGNAANVLQVLFQFPRVAGAPQHPATSLIEAGDGTFWGTTAYGGLSDCGTVFKITKAGECFVVASFKGTNGSNPYFGLTLGSDGNYYGTTARGGTGYSGSFSGNGTVFRVSSGGAVTSLYTFKDPDGYRPVGPLVQAADGALYGITSAGGAYGLGTLFRITTNGAWTRLYSFDGTNGMAPNPTLVWGGDGFLYGTTEFGGSNYSQAWTGNGTVYRVATNGVFSVVFYFGDSNGRSPKAGLSLTHDGAFVGTTSSGGTAGFGTVFRLTTNGEFASLFSFDGSEGVRPFAGVIEGSDGNLYGTTAYAGLYYTNFGTVFKLTPGGNLTTLAYLDGTNGMHAMTGLTLGSDGYLYGAMADATLSGLVNSGTIYRLPQAPKLLSVKYSEGRAVVSWNSYTRGVYRVEGKDSLGDSGWTPLLPEITAQDNTASFTNSLESNQQFYRVGFRP